MGAPAPSDVTVVYTIAVVPGERRHAPCDLVECNPLKIDQRQAGRKIRQLILEFAAEMAAFQTDRRSRQLL
jgi:hypothetical protein